MLQVSVKLYDSVREMEKRVLTSFLIKQ